MTEKQPTQAELTAGMVAAKAQIRNALDQLCSLIPSCEDPHLLEKLLQVTESAEADISAINALTHEKIDDQLADTEQEEEKEDNYSQLAPSHREASVIMNRGKKEDLERLDNKESKEKAIAKELKYVLKGISNGRDKFDDNKHGAQLIDLARTLINLYKPSASSIVAVLTGSSLVRNVFKIHNPDKIRQKFINGDEVDGKKTKPSAREHALQEKIESLKGSLGVIDDISEGFKYFRKTFYALHTLDPLQLWKVEDCEIFVQECIQQANDYVGQIFGSDYDYHPLVKSTDDIAKLRAMAISSPSSKEQFEIMQSAYTKLEVIHKFLLVKRLKAQNLKQASLALESDLKTIIREHNSVPVLNPPTENDHNDILGQQAKNHVEIDRLEVDTDTKEEASIVRKMFLKSLLQPENIDDLVRARMYMPEFMSYSREDNRKIWFKERLHDAIATAVAILLTKLGNDYILTRIRYTIESGGSNTYSTGEHRGVHLTFTYKYSEQPKKGKNKNAVCKPECTSPENLEELKREGMVELQEEINGKVVRTFLVDGIFPVGSNAVRVSSKTPVFGDDPEALTTSILKSHTAEIQILGHMTTEEEKQDHARYVQGKSDNIKKAIGIDLSFRDFIMQLVEVINTRYDFKQSYSPLDKNNPDDPSGIFPFDKENYREKLMLIAILSKRGKDGKLVNQDTINEICQDPDSKRELLKALRKVKQQPKNNIVSFRVPVELEEAAEETEKKRQQLSVKKILGKNPQEEIERQKEKMAAKLSQAVEYGRIQSFGEIQTHQSDFTMVIRKRAAAAMDMITHEDFRAPVIKKKVFYDKDEESWKKRTTFTKRGNKRAREPITGVYIGPLYLKKKKNKDGSMTYSEVRSEVKRTGELKKPLKTQEVVHNNIFTIKRDGRNLQCFRHSETEDIKIWEIVQVDSKQAHLIVFDTKTSEVKTMTPFTGDPQNITPYSGIMVSEQQAELFEQIKRTVLNRSSHKKNKKRGVPSNRNIVFIEPVAETD